MTRNLWLNKYVKFLLNNTDAVKKTTPEIVIGLMYAVYGLDDEMAELFKDDAEMQAAIAAYPRITMQDAIKHLKHITS